MNETEGIQESEIDDVTKCTLIYNWAAFLLVLWLQIVLTCLKFRHEFLMSWNMKML